MIYDIILNMEKSGIKPRIKVSQYDDSVPQIRATLYSQNQPYTPPSGTTAYISGTKADNTGFKYECTVSGNTVTADVSQQMTAFSGDVECEFTFEAQGVRKGTENFILEVEQTALADDVIISESDIPAIQRLGQIATTERLGVVKVDGTTVTIDEDGTLHSSASGTGTVKKVNGQSPDASGEVTITTANISDNASKRFVSDTEKTTWNGKADLSDIPDELADLSDDATHRLVTDTEKTTWNGKSVVSFSQTQHTGTEVGEITIDGNTTKLFAPTGGGGGGDMYASTYDPNGDVANAGGIPAYVSAHSGGSGKPNLNLLSNGWFKVNTKGQTSWSKSQLAEVSMLDRWILLAADCSQVANGLQYTAAQYGQIRQYVPTAMLDSSLTYTVSVKMSDGTIYSNQVKTSDTSSKPLNASSPTLNARLNSSGLLQIAFGQGESYTIRAVKLEIGTESTLVYDAEPTIGLTDIIADGDINAITSNAVYDAQEIVAKHEDGTTSSKAYAIGDYFIRGGKFCKVTQAIASGGTFTKNTNYSEVDVGSELVGKADASDVYPTVNFGSTTAEFVKIAGLKPSTSGGDSTYILSMRFGDSYLISWGGSANEVPYVAKLSKGGIYATSVLNDTFYYSGSDLAFRLGYNYVYGSIKQLSGVKRTLTVSYNGSTNPLTNPTTLTTNDLTNKQNALTFTSTPSATNKVVALQDLSVVNCQDTQITSPTNGQVLKYNGSAWVNSNESGGSTTSGSWVNATGVSGSLDIKQYGNVVHISGYLYNFNGNLTADTSMVLGTYSGVSMKTLTTTCLTNSQGATTCGDCSQISLGNGTITLIPKAARYNGWDCWVDTTYIV